MAEPCLVLVPKENVNDETARLVAWFVEDGAHVEAGRLLAQVETSKAVLDIEAPSAGVVRFAAKAGDEVEIGGVLCRIGDGSEPIGAPLPRAEDPSAIPGAADPGARRRGGPEGARGRPEQRPRPRSTFDIGLTAIQPIGARAPLGAGA